MLRAVLGIVVGIAVSMGCITVVEWLGHQIIPPPVGASMSTPEVVANYIATAPTMALLFPPLGWFVGAAVGGWAARSITRTSWAGWAIAGLVLIGGIINLLLIPAPIWMQIAAVSAPLLGGWVATRLPAGAKDNQDGDARAL